MGPLVTALDGHKTVTTGDQVTAREFLHNLPSLNGSGLYDDISERLGAKNDGQRAAAVELALKVSTSPGGSPRSPTTRRRSTAE